MKEPETPTRSGSVLLWGPAWVRPFTTWSGGGETNTVFVFVFFQAFLRQIRLLCLSLGGICFFIYGSMRQLSDKALLFWTMKMIFQSIPHHFLLKDRKEVCKNMKNSYLGVHVNEEAFPVQIWTWGDFPCPNLNVVRASVDICCETWNYSPCLHVQGLSYEELWEKLNPPLRCFVSNTY